MDFDEQAVTFPCGENWLYGIASLPATATKRGVLMVVGGPQYRSGSHRQFTLLARELAHSGTPVFRFDYRGMGDSEGEIRGYTDINEDLHAAINAFFKAAPSLTEIVIWGLCDGASAGIFYAHYDERVSGLVLVNPWARSRQGIAKTYLKRYYLKRLLSIDFWKKVHSGGLDWATTIKSFLKEARHAIFQSKNPSSAVTALSKKPHLNEDNLPERLYQGLLRFKGQVLVILSENDLTAQEFQQLAHGSRRWRKLITSKRMATRILSEANHTFSRQVWRSQVSEWTKDWLKAW